MDNRLIFLYLSMTELWGHVRRALAGMESRGKRRRGHIGKSVWQPKGVMPREISTEVVDFTLPRKAASKTVGARTVNRHR